MSAALKLIQETEQLSEKPHLGENRPKPRLVWENPKLSAGTHKGKSKVKPDASYGRVHYNYFRDYDPGTGRYVQSDPISVGEHVMNWSTLRAAQHSTEFREQLIALGDMEVLSLASQSVPPLELNPYAYVANNPLLWTDPTGESIGGFGGFGGSSTSGGLQCGDDDKNK